MVVKRRQCIQLGAFLALALTGCGKAKTVVPEYVLTYADNQPEDYPTTRGAQRFAELVQQRTGGRVVIQLKFGGELGSEAEVLTQLRMGSIDFARLSLAGMTEELPKLNVLQLPFLFEDAQQMWRVMDSEIGTDFLAEFEQLGLVGLSWYDAGARSFYSAQQPIRSPEDMQGLTVRVQDSRIVMDMVTLLGAQPVTFSYSDVYYAFETKKIDVAENNWPAYQAMKHYKVARYYTVDEHSRIPEAQLASGETWTKLPEEYRQILAECAVESALYERELWIEQEASARETTLSRGCEEIVLTGQQRDAFRTAVQPLYESYCGEYRELVAKIQKR